jgi:ligand-binding SRPBCC domain-containing protein
MSKGRRPRGERVPADERVGRRASPRTHVLERTQVVAVAQAEAFAFFADARNLEVITPRWLGFRILEAPSRLERGSRLRYRLRLGPLPVRWLTEIEAWQPPRGFTDVQLRGPYRLWVHTHRLTPVAGGTEIYDHVRYRLAGEPLASLVRPLTVERWLDEVFDYRAESVATLLG